MPDKKIFCLAPYNFLPPKMGGQKAIDSFYRLLSKKWEVVCICTKDNQDAVARPYQLKQMLTTGKLRYIDVFFLFRLIKLIRKENPDLLEMEQPYFGWLMVAVKKITSKPLLVRSHNIEGLRFKTIGKWWWKMMWYYEKWVYKNSDRIFFITDEDRKYAIEQMALDSKKAFTLSYSIDATAPPSAADRNIAKRNLQKRHSLNEADRLLLFNGSFDYLPNTEALRALVFHFDEFKRSYPNYSLIICGKDIPDDLMLTKNDRVVFAGFVPDISEYYFGADVFLNPVISGGGIKTKLVEALGSNMNAVSFVSGAIGIDPGWCNGKLLIVENNNWNLFLDAIQKAVVIEASVGEAFFNHFSASRQLEKITDIL